LYQKCARI